MLLAANESLDHQQIADCLPHSGRMCLLQKIVQADQASLTALADSHLLANNPLRINGRIASVNGIEYAAQAMAVHGALLAETVKPGYIATVRNIEVKQSFLPENGQPLIIHVQQLMSDDNGFTYQFAIHCDEEIILSGRITVFLIPE